jgi:hypothetical protein
MTYFDQISLTGWQEGVKRTGIEGWEGRHDMWSKRAYLTGPGWDDKEQETAGSMTNVNPKFE